MPILLFNPPNNFYASKDAERQAHDGMDTQFGSMYCGIFNKVVSESYALVQSGRVYGNAPNTWGPYDTVLKGNLCYAGPLSIQWWDLHCTSSYSTPDRCENFLKQYQEQALGYTCTTPNTSFTQNIQGITVHPCASVGQIKSLYDYKIPEQSSAVAEREMNPKLDEAKVKFLAPLIRTIRSAYFLAGGIIGGWLVYLNAKSENLSFGENFLKTFPPSIPTIPAYSGGMGGATT